MPEKVPWDTCRKGRGTSYLVSYPLSSSWNFPKWVVRPQSHNETMSCLTLGRWGLLLSYVAFPHCLTYVFCSVSTLIPPPSNCFLSHLCPIWECAGLGDVSSPPAWKRLALHWSTMQAQLVFQELHSTIPNCSGREQSPPPWQLHCFLNMVTVSSISQTHVSVCTRYQPEVPLLYSSFIRHITMSTWIQIANLFLDTMAFCSH